MFAHYIDIFNDIMFWALAFMLVWQAYILVFNRGVPNIRTAPAIRRRIIERLADDRAARDMPSYNIVDLGSGNGLFSRDIARGLPGASITGYEISSASIAQARLWQRIFKLEHIIYKKADFFEADLSQADAVVFYLTVFEMGRLAEKFRAGLKPGTLIISNRFPLNNGWEPVEMIHVKTWALHQKTFYVYRA